MFGFALLQIAYWLRRLRMTLAVKMVGRIAGEYVVFCNGGPTTAATRAMALCLSTAPKDEDDDEVTMSADSGPADVNDVVVV